MQGLEGLSVFLFHKPLVRCIHNSIHTGYSIWLLPFSSLDLVSVYPSNDCITKSRETTFTAMSPLDISEKDKMFSKHLANLHRELQYLRFWKEAGCNLLQHHSQYYGTLQPTWQKTQISDNQGLS